MGQSLAAIGMVVQVVIEVLTGCANESNSRSEQKPDSQRAVEGSNEVIRVGKRGRRPVGAPSCLRGSWSDR